LQEETSDRNPAYEWARQELEKANAELAGFQARARATAVAAGSYRERARSLEEQAIVEDNLVRIVKTSEENYLLYARKEEEARTSAALDRGRILNVAIADPATAPSLPSSHRSRTVLLGAVIAAALSAGVAFSRERMDSTFRTPAELGSFLNAPVLAAISKDALENPGLPALGGASRSAESPATLQ
jgi:uncharacterized protein involved in exopolysaccharide biosynthesis